MYNFYNENKEKGKQYVAAHFLAENAPKATIYRHINSAASGKQLARKNGSGRKPIFNTPNNRVKIKKIFRKAARKFKCSHITIRNILRKMQKPILCYKREKRPNRTHVQRLVARPKSRRLLQVYRNVNFILDDESNFTLSNSVLTGNDSYYTNDKNLTPDDVKYIDKAKYEEKVLVWVAISPKGNSQIYMRPSGMAINQEVYLNECIKKRLVPFVQEHYRNGKYVFWPDLASSHFAKSVIEWLNNNNVKFVPKNLNIANVPEARPIEDFWAIMKKYVYKDGWTARNVTEL